MRKCRFLKIWCEHNEVYAGFDGSNYLFISFHGEPKKKYYLSIMKVPVNEIDNFLNNFYAIRKFEGNEEERKRALERAYSKIGNKLDYINFNCEHFANYVQTGKFTSSYVNIGKIGVGIIGTLILYKIFKKVLK